MLLYLALVLHSGCINEPTDSAQYIRYLSLVWKSSNFILIVFVSRFVASPSTLLECFVHIHSSLSLIQFRSHFSQWIAIEIESNLIKYSSSFNNKCGWNFQHKKNYANNHILTLGFCFVFGGKIWSRIVCAIEFQPVNNNNIELNYVVVEKEQLFKHCAAQRNQNNIIPSVCAHMCTVIIEFFDTNNDSHEHKRIERGKHIFFYLRRMTSRIEHFGDLFGFYFYKSIAEFQSSLCS